MINLTELYAETATHVKRPDAIVGRESCPNRQLLQHMELMNILGPTMTETASERARQRLRDEMARKKLNQSDVAGMLGWTQSRVSKILHGRIELGVEELAAVAFALGLTLTEVVRDHGLEFCAEMTPTELRIHERIRQLAPDQRAALMTILNVAAKTRMEERRAIPKPKAVKASR